MSLVVPNDRRLPTSDQDRPRLEAAARLQQCLGISKTRRRLDGSVCRSFEEFSDTGFRDGVPVCNLLQHREPPNPGGRLSYTEYHARLDRQREARLLRRTVAALSGV